MVRFGKTKRGKATSGLTLVEVMVATAISATLLAATVSSLIFFTRSGLLMEDHYEMESERSGLIGYFSRDTRKASGASWTSSSILVLTVDGSTVTYTYNPTDETVSRKEAGKTEEVLAWNVDTLSFRGFDRTGTEITDSNLLSDDCKMIQLHFTQERTGTNRITGRATTVSPRYLLRNKTFTAP